MNHHGKDKKETKYSKNYNLEPIITIINLVYFILALLMLIFYFTKFGSDFKCFYILLFSFNI